EHAGCCSLKMFASLFVFLNDLATIDAVGFERSDALHQIDGALDNTGISASLDCFDKSGGERVFFPFGEPSIRQSQPSMYILWCTCASLLQLLKGALFGCSADQDAFNARCGIFA